MPKLKLVQPRLVVFDLDRTLWPFGIDEFVFKPPYRKTIRNRVVDSENKELKPFSESRYVLHHLHLSKLFSSAMPFEFI